MQESIHADKALNPETFGELAEMVLKMLIRTKNKVTKSVILPATTSGSIKKLTYHSIINKSKELNE